MLIGNKLKLYNTQGTKIIIAKLIGNKTVQQKAINWSNRILGKEALAQINVNIIKELFNPKLNPYNNPSITELFKKSVYKDCISINVTQSIKNNSKKI
jgi:hypothetical protein